MSRGQLTQRPIVLVGGGGHCRSVMEAAESAGLTIAGVLDESDEAKCGVLGYPCLGGDDLIPALAADHDFVVTVGQIKSCAVRRRLHKLISDSGGRLATVVASSAVVSRHATLGPGTVVLHHATVNAGASVGFGCIINTGAIVEHDVSIGPLTHISTSAVVNGGASVGEGVFIGSNATVNQGVAIADGAVVASGSLVTHDIVGEGIYKGLI